MALFLSTYTNKVDKKGRVSVPASFRAALAGEAFQGVVLLPSNVHACIEGFSYAKMDEISARLDNFDLFSADQDDLAATVFGAAAPLNFDGDGRILLPEGFLQHAQIEEAACFVGMGRKFQIWSPDFLKQRQAEASKNVRDGALTIPAGGADG